MNKTYVKTMYNLVYMLTGLIYILYMLIALIEWYNMYWTVSQ